MNRSLLLVILGVLPPILLSCAAAERASDQESDLVIRASTACMISAANELDDHKSDAVTVAYGILGRCDQQLRDEYAMAGKGFSFDNQQSIKRKLEENSLKEATEIVLKERADRIK